MLYQRGFTRQGSPLLQQFASRGAGGAPGAVMPRMSGNDSTRQQLQIDPALLADIRNNINKAMSPSDPYLSPPQQSYMGQGALTQGLSDPQGLLPQQSYMGQGAYTQNLPDPQNLLPSQNNAYMGQGALTGNLSNPSLMDMISSWWNS